MFVKGRWYIIFENDVPSTFFIPFVANTYVRLSLYERPETSAFGSVLARIQ